MRISRRFDSPWFPVLAHLSLALWLWARGMRFCGGQGRYCGWDWIWQGIPEVDLLHRPWSSLWYLHAQPPGFSLWGLAWLHAFGPEHFPDSIQFGQMLLGGLIVGLTWRLARDLGAGRRFAWLAAVGIAVNPSLLLFEAYPVYTVLVSALVMLTVACLGRALFCAARPGGGGTAAWLAGYAAALNALALTRSLYHWAFVWAAVALAWPAWRRLGRRARVALLIATLAPVGLWYGKNQLQYGFFGASSWFGLGLYRCVSEGYDYHALSTFREDGLIPGYVQDNRPFTVQPGTYRAYGFTQTSAIPLLANNDFHNINVVAIGKGYRDASFRLIWRDPWHYALNVARAFGIYCVPPSSFFHLEHNRITYLRQWEQIVTKGFYMGLLTDLVDLRTRIQLGSSLAFILPLLLIWGAWWGLRRWRRGSGLRRFGLGRARALLMAYLVLINFYVPIVGSMFEYGENMRFHAATEPLTLVMLLMMIQSVWLCLPKRVRDELQPRLFGKSA